MDISSYSSLHAAKEMSGERAGSALRRQCGSNSATPLTQVPPFSAAPAATEAMQRNRSDPNLHAQ